MYHNDDGYVTVLVIALVPILFILSFQFIKIAHDYRIIKQSKRIDRLVPEARQAMLAKMNAILPEQTEATLKLGSLTIEAKARTTHDRLNINDLTPDRPAVRKFFRSLLVQAGYPPSTARNIIKWRNKEGSHARRPTGTAFRTLDEVRFVRGINHLGLTKNFKRLFNTNGKLAIQNINRSHWRAIQEVYNPAVLANYPSFDESDFQSSLKRQWSKTKNVFPFLTQKQTKYKITITYRYNNTKRKQNYIIDLDKDQKE